MCGWVGWVGCVEISGLIWGESSCSCSCCFGFELEVQDTLLTVVVVVVVGLAGLKVVFEEKDMAGSLRVLFVVRPVGWLAGWMDGLDGLDGLSVWLYGLDGLAGWMTLLLTCGCVRIFQFCVPVEGPMNPIKWRRFIAGCSALSCPVLSCPMEGRRGGGGK